MIQTLYSVPTVFVGLLVFITLSKDGPLGGLGILFTSPGHSDGARDTNIAHHNGSDHLGLSGEWRPR